MLPIYGVGGLPVLLRAGLVGESVDHDAGQIRPVPGAEQGAVASGPQDVGEGRQVGGDDASARGHGLDEHDPEGLPPGLRGDVENISKPLQPKNLLI